MGTGRVRWLLIILAAIGVTGVSLGARQAFGLFLKPVTMDLDWPRATFAFAVAVRELTWGVSQPFLGMLADRYGAGRVVALGGLAYALGLYAMSEFLTPVAFLSSAGLLIGLGLSATSFSIVLGPVGRATPPERRSQVLGLVTAGGGLGLLFLPPVGQRLIEVVGWGAAAVVLAGTALGMVPLALALGGPAAGGGGPPARPGLALWRALGYARYWLLFWGFLVCGFHVSFIMTHLPAYVVDRGISPSIAAGALALIGLFTIAGSYAFGVLGGIFSKKNTLALLYLARSAVIVAFLAFPLSDFTVLAFGASIGLLWLGTLPLTSGLVAHIFGVRYVSTLFGFVFFAHQVGSFLGVWLGGWAYDVTGSYNAVWYGAIGLGVMAALLHWRIREEPVPLMGTLQEATA